MFFVILILYIIVLILLQVDSVSETQLLSDKLIVLSNVLKDFFLVIISIIGTTLLTSTIIEKIKRTQHILSCWLMTFLLLQNFILIFLTKISRK